MCWKQFEKKANKYKNLVAILTAVFTLTLAVATCFMVFASFQNIDLTKKIVEKERLLDHLFASQRIDEEKLRIITLEIGTLQGELRAVHLKAHLEMRQILTPHQIQRYDELRGYQRAGGEHKHHGHHGGHH